MIRSMSLLSVDHTIRPVESASSRPAHCRLTSPQGSPCCKQTRLSDFFCAFLLVSKSMAKRADGRGLSDGERKEYGLCWANVW